MMALLRAPVPRIYSNGYAIASTASDISLVHLFNGMPVGISSMSYITAKSLVAELTQTLLDFEKAVKQEIKTMTEITEALGQVKGPGNVV